MSSIEDKFIGKWESPIGQRISIRRAPIFGLFANYYPASGRPRFLLTVVVYEQELIVPLTLASVLGTVLKLSLASELATRNEILVPELQLGTESDWWEEDYGVPWAVPLAVFRKQAQDG